MFGNSISGIGTESHELHRIRRGAIEGFFSKASVRRLEPAVQTVVDKLVARLDDVKRSDRIVNVGNMFSAFTADVVAQYAFARPYGYLDDSDFAPQWHQTIQDIAQNTHFLKQFGWVEPMMRSMPRWFVKIVAPQMMALISMQDVLNHVFYRCSYTDIQQEMHKEIVEIKEELAKGNKPGGRTTIFYDILTNNNLRPQEKQTAYLMDESQVVVAAGTVTTAHILSILTYHLIDNPEILEKLQSELRTVMPDSQTQATWQQLESLPYMVCHNPIH